MNIDSKNESKFNLRDEVHLDSDCLNSYELFTNYQQLPNKWLAKKDSIVYWIDESFIHKLEDCPYLKFVKFLEECNEYNSRAELSE